MSIVRRAYITALVAIVLLCTAASLVLPLSAHALDDGAYKVDVSFVQATSESTSMADAALKKPAMLYVKQGQSRLSFGITSIKVGTSKGYLGELSYKPSTSDAFTSASVDSRYTKVKDSYNATSSKDKRMAGKKYPKTLSLFFSDEKEEILCSVYIPLMESISSGAGTQKVRLRIDYDSAVRSGDVPQNVSLQDSRQLYKSAYTQLASAIKTAERRIAKKSKYTVKSITALITARAQAQELCENGSATKAEVIKQTSKLKKCISSLAEKKKKRQTKKTGKSTTGKKNTTKKKTSSKLKLGSLKDGAYTITGKVLKTDRKSTSMADKAVSHSVQLDVKNGKHYLTISLRSVKIGSQESYLGSLKYYKNGRRAGQGSTGKGTVLSYQRSASGKKFSDKYGSNYPRQIRIPFLKASQTDGYVPLHVFVPVMDFISSGNGDQDMYLKLELNTIVKGTSSASSQRESTPTISSGDSESASESTSNVNTAKKKTKLTVKGLSKAKKKNKIPGQIFTAVVSPSYEHPQSGEIEDSGGKSAYATGQGMVESAVSKKGVLEVGTDGSFYLTMRMNLIDHIKSIDLKTQEPSANKWKSIKGEVTKQGSNRNGTTYDVRVKVPSQNAIVRIDMFVQSMGRSVIYYVSLDKLKAGAPKGFKTLVVTGDMEIGNLYLDTAEKQDDATELSEESGVAAAQGLSLSTKREVNTASHQLSADNSLNPAFILTLILLALAVVIAAGVILFVWHMRRRYGVIGDDPDDYSEEYKAAERDE